MEYIWLIIIVVIIMRAVERLTKRPGYRGEYGTPQEEMPFDVEDLPPGSSTAGEPGESGPVLDLPAYPAGRGSLTVAGNVSRYEGRQEGPPAVQRRPNRGGDIDTRREPGDGRCGAAELFDGRIGQREFIKGMVWSQILGPRGGIQASKRFKHR